jgi:Spy/CpxP family protein refolding chaperone
MKTLIKTALVGIGSLLLVAMLSVQAQNPPPPGGGGGGDRGRGGPGGPGGGRGGFDMNSFMERMMTEAQKNLGASDDEWKVLRPLIEDVMKKQREASTRGSIFSLGRSSTDSNREGDRGRRGGPPGMGGSTETPREYEALKTVIERNASPEEMKQRMEALREYRKKKEEELKAAREKLRALLTAKQEAQLVLVSILD